MIEAVRPVSRIDKVLLINNGLWRSGFSVVRLGESYCDEETIACQVSCLNFCDGRGHEKSPPRGGLHFANG